MDTESKKNCSKHLFTPTSWGMSCTSLDIAEKADADWCGLGFWAVGEARYTESETCPRSYCSYLQLLFQLSVGFILIFRLLGLIFLISFIFFICFIFSLTIGLLGALPIITIVLLRFGLCGLITGDLIVAFFALLFLLFLFLLAELGWTRHMIIY